MPRAKLKFWLAFLNLVLVVSGFLVGQATKIAFIGRCIDGTAYDARVGLSGLISKSATQGRDLGFGGNLDGRPFIDRSDTGFQGLAILYSSLVSSESKPGDQIGTISRFIDACAIIPDKRGFANMVVVDWAHGVKTQTSYEEIREMISEKSDASIRPWQYGLFGMSFCVAVAMFTLTYFPQPKSEIVDAKPKDDGARHKKTDEPDPTKNE